MACGGCKQSVPPTGTMIVNAGAAAVAFAGAAIQGKRVFVDDAVRDARLAACLACPNCIAKDYNGTIYHRCSLCGCWLDGKYLKKASLATESCPDKRWAT